MGNLLVCCGVLFALTACLASKC